MGIVKSGAEAEFGIAKQSAEGTAAANPAYAMPVFEGLPRPVQSVEMLQVTSTTLEQVGVYKTDQHWEANVVVPGFPASLGTILKGLFPTDTSTGSGDPYTHTFSISGTTPWFTLFSRRPGDLYEKFTDGLLQEVTFEFSKDSPLRVGTTYMGKTSEILGSAYTAAATEVVSSTSEWFTPIGGTFKMDIDSDTPVAVDNIATGTVRFSRNTDPEPTASSLSPSYFNRGVFEVGVSLDLIWKDYSAYRASYFGSVTGSTFSSDVVVGSVELEFAANYSDDHTLKIVLPSVALLVPEAPQPDAGGGAVRISIDGMGVKPASGSLATVVLKNAVSTAY